MSNSDFSDADPWGIPLEDASTTTDVEANPVEDAEPEGDAHDEPDTPVDVDVPDESVAASAPEPEPTALVGSDDSEVDEADVEGALDQLGDFEAEVAEVPSDDTPSDDDMLFGEASDEPEDLTDIARLAAELAGPEDAVEPSDDAPLFAAQDDESGDGALSQMVSTAMSGASVPTSDEASTEDDEGSDENDDRPNIPARSGLGLSRMIAAAQSVFTSEDEEAEPTAQPADEQLPDELPSWAVPDDGSEPTNDLFGSTPGPIDPPTTVEAAEESDDAVEPTDAASAPDAFDTPETADVEIAPADDTVEDHDHDHDHDHESDELADVTSALEAIDTPDIADIEIAPADEIIEDHSEDDEPDDLADVTSVLQAISAPDLSVDADDDTAESTEDDLHEPETADIADALALLGSDDNGVELVDEPEDPFGESSDDAPDESISSAFDLSPSSPIIEFGATDADEAVAAIEPDEPEAQPADEPSPFSLDLPASEPAADIEGTADAIDEDSEETDAAEDETQPAFGEISSAMEEEISTILAAIEPAGESAEIMDDAVEETAEAVTDDDEGADDDQIVVSTEHQDADAPETDEDPWQSLSDDGATEDDGIDVPISTLPVPSVYSELEELPPTPEPAPVFGLADHDEAAWGERWDESAQGWIENDSGETVWRPIVSTAPSLAGWDIETYLGVVTGDAAIDADDLAQARATALHAAVADALQRGAHAVIGVQFSVVQVGDQSMMSATGTGVTLRSS